MHLLLNVFSNLLLFVRYFPVDADGGGIDGICLKSHNCIKLIYFWRIDRLIVVKTPAANLKA